MVPIERLVISSASRGFNFAATLMNKLTAIQKQQTQRHFPAAAVPEKLSIVTHTKFKMDFEQRVSLHSRVK